MAANIAALPVSSPSYAAHSHYVARLHTDTCNTDPSGRTQACYLWETLYHEFLTSHGCRLSTIAKVEECAATATITYGVKHKDGLLDTIGRGMTLLQLGQWLWEGYNWCIANGMTCSRIVGSGMCEVEDFACNNGAMLTDTTSILIGVDDNLPGTEGYGEWLLSYALSGAEPIYDSPYGYGPWGVLDESYDCTYGDIGSCP